MTASPHDHPDLFSQSHHAGDRQTGPRALTWLDDIFGKGRAHAAAGPIAFDEIARTSATDPRPRTAIVDRLTFSGTIIETGTQSY